MAQNANNGGLLKSWKEIAAYLDCSVRTCRRWEERYGLPIHRIGNAAKSGIFAYKSEVDAWLRETGGGLDEIERGGAGARPGASIRPAGPGHPDAPAGAGARGDATSADSPHRRALVRLSLTPLAVAAVAVAVVGIAVTLILVFFPPPFLRAPGEPADFRIEKSTLVITNAKGRELWRFDTKLPALLSEAQYRGRFQRRQIPAGESRRLLPLLIIRDINRDGHVEVLFAPASKEEIGTDRLYCLDHRGRELWSISAGGPIKFGNMTFADFVIHGVDVFDLFGDGRSEIVCLSHAFGEWPTRLLVLAEDGRRLGEYWNSGHFVDAVCADLDKDGRREILAEGLNNEYKKGCLAVFDPGAVNGCSPQSEPEFTCADLDPGSETAYLLFPRTEVDRLIYPVECMTDIMLMTNDSFRIKASQSEILYDLDFRLDIRDVLFSHGFQQKYNEFWRAGKIRPELTLEYQRELEKRLKSEVLYYDRTTDTWRTRD